MTETPITLDMLRDTMHELADHFTQEARERGSNWSREEGFGLARGFMMQITDEQYLSDVKGRDIARLYRAARGEIDDAAQFRMRGGYVTHMLVDSDAIGLPRHISRWPNAVDLIAGRMPYLLDPCAAARSRAVLVAEGLTSPTVGEAFANLSAETLKLAHGIAAALAPIAPAMLRAAQEAKPGGPTMTLADMQEAFARSREKYEAQRTAFGRPPYDSGSNSARLTSDAEQSQQVPAREPHDRTFRIKLAAKLDEWRQIPRELRGPMSKTRYRALCEEVLAEMRGETPKPPESPELRSARAFSQGLEDLREQMRKEDEGLRARLALEADRTREHFGWFLFYTARDAAETLGHNLIALYRWVTR